MRKHFTILFIILLTGNTSALAIDFSRVNIAWQYDLLFPVQMDHRVIENAEGITVFLRVQSDSLNNWTYEFLLQKGYTSESERSVEPAIDTLRQSSNEVVLRIDVGMVEENLLIVKFYQPEEYFYYDVGLKIGSLSFPSIYPVDTTGLPIFERYIHRSDYTMTGSDRFLVMQFPEQFTPADPPMEEMKPLAPQVAADTSFMMSGDSSLSTGYFYTFLKDSIATVGVTVLRMPPYFPEYRQLGELVEAMLYLTSEPERKSLLNARNLKKTFDSFWMNTYSTKSRARTAIRRYYNLIKRSNRLFTDFKPGWKTDRGMMYIIFGKPNEVFRTANSEEWYYDDGKAFEFTIISSFFAPRTYGLRRSREFEDLWFTQLATIRRSINE